MGKVVDMFYFPLFQWNSVPNALRFLVDSQNYFSERFQLGRCLHLGRNGLSASVPIQILLQIEAFRKNIGKKYGLYEKVLLLHTVISTMPRWRNR